jgi:hypothetical protein
MSPGSQRSAAARLSLSREHDRVLRHCMSGVMMMVNKLIW